VKPDHVWKLFKWIDAHLTEEHKKVSKIISISKF
jgi:hypothetical protein